MRFALGFIAVLALLPTVGCFNIGSSEKLDPRPEELIWVARHFTGGRQCEPVIRYTAPDTEQLLHAAGIPAYQTQTVHLAICEACSCPSYSAMHYALIRREQLASVREIGFEPNEPARAIGE